MLVLAIVMISSGFKRLCIVHALRSNWKSDAVMREARHGAVHQVMLAHESDAGTILRPASEHHCHIYM